MRLLVTECQSVGVKIIISLILLLHKSTLINGGNLTVLDYWVEFDW